MTATKKTVILLAFATSSTGCGSLLGLDDFQDAAGEGGAGATTSTTSTTSGGACTPGEAEACAYGGQPASSEGVGVCHAGERTCLEDGSGFGPCEGELVPSEESCAVAGLDEDCDGAVDEDCTCVPNEDISCYSGPAGTLGVGVCAEGKATCSADGKTLGACTGEVTPSPETCKGLEDENCDGIECVAWAKRFGDANDQYIAAVGSNDQDEVFIAGNFTGAMDLGDGPHFSVGAADMFLAKLNADGSPKWFFSVPGGFGVLNMRVDSAGGVVIGGLLSKATTIGATTYSPNGVASLIIKVDANGVFQWARQLDKANVPSVAVLPAGDVIATGLIQGSVDFGTGMLPFGGLSDAYLLRLDSSDGHTIFAQSIGGPGLEEGTAVAATFDSIYLVGYYDQAISLAGSTLPAAPQGQFYTFFARYDINGAPIVGNSLPLLIDYPSIAAPPGFSVYLGFSFAGSKSLGGTTIVSSGGVDGMLLKLQTNGFLQAQTQLMGPGDDRILAIDGDVAGNVVVGFSITQDASFGTDAFVLQGAHDFGVMKIDAQGNSWFRTWPTTAISPVPELHVSSLRASLGAVAGGPLVPDADVGGISLPSNGGSDAFVATFPAP